jgi:hypothetical protein
MELIYGVKFKLFMTVVILIIIAGVAFIWYALSDYRIDPNTGKRK